MNSYAFIQKRRRRNEKQSKRGQAFKADQKPYLDKDDGIYMPVCADTCDFCVFCFGFVVVPDGNRPRAGNRPRKGHSKAL